VSWIPSLPARVERAVTPKDRLCHRDNVTRNDAITVTALQCMLCAGPNPLGGTRSTGLKIAEPLFCLRGFCPPALGIAPIAGRQRMLRPTGRQPVHYRSACLYRRGAAYNQGVKPRRGTAAQHLQDHGDWPKGLVMDMWGSATMPHPAGEEFAMALHLAGLSPRWDDRQRPRQRVRHSALALLTARALT